MKINAFNSKAGRIGEIKHVAVMFCISFSVLSGVNASIAGDLPVASRLHDMLVTIDEGVLTPNGLQGVHLIGDEEQQYWYLMLSFRC